MKTRYTLRSSELLPEHYKPIKEPFYSGKGNHCVVELEAICEAYKELVHQLRVREQSLLRLTKSEII